MRVLRLAWLGIRTEAAQAMVEFFGSTLGLRLDHADDNGSVFVLPGGGKVEVDGPHVADWAHFTTGPVAGFLVDDVVAATEELRQAGIAILSGPFVFETGVAWVHFRGPDGNVYGLTQGRDLEPAESVEQRGEAPVGPALSPHAAVAVNAVRAGVIRIARGGAGSGSRRGRPIATRWTTGRGRFSVTAMRFAGTVTA